MAPRPPAGRPAPTRQTGFQPALAACDERLAAGSVENCRRTLGDRLARGVACLKRILGRPWVTGSGPAG